MTKLFIYLFVSIICSQAVSVDLLRSIDSDIIKELVEDLTESEENDNEEKEAEKEYINNVALYAAISHQHQTFTQNVTCKEDEFSQYYGEVPLPPPDFS